MDTIKGKVILVTGGTGSFGHEFVKQVLPMNPKKLIVFSRDEFKQYNMEQLYPEGGSTGPMRYLLGDVRDKERLWRAFDGVDIVIHAAALKQVPKGEYDSWEFVKTNVLGAHNVIETAVDRGVQSVIALSSDKSSEPLNNYGATKLVSDKLFLTARSLSSRTSFSVVRYGNVMGSRGSAIPFFQKQAEEGLITITDERMTRFWISLSDAVKFVLRALQEMSGGEMFVPKIPSMKIVDLAEAIAPGVPTKVIGIRPGEKLHEIMISRNDARNTYDIGWAYKIDPCNPWDGANVPADFEYRSDNNTEWITVERLREMIGSSTGT